jgi:hypothetical protein
MSNNKAVFDPTTSFFELKIVRMTVLIIFLLSILSAVIIYKDPALKLTLKPSYEGFNNLLNIFKFPIGLLATLIPIIAVFVANHRSEQTKAQMLLTQTQINLSESQLKTAYSNNNFVNYFKHIDEFEKSLTKHQEQDVAFGDKAGTIEFINPRRLHKEAFPNVKSGNLKVNQTFAEEIEKDISHLIEVASGLKTHQNIPETMYNLHHAYNQIAQKYHIKQFSSIIINGVEPEPPNPLKTLVYPIGHLSRALLNILSFDETYKIPILLYTTASYDYEKISGGSPRQADETLPFNIQQLINNKMAAAL